MYIENAFRICSVLYSDLQKWRLSSAIKFEFARLQYYLREKFRRNLKRFGTGENFSMIPLSTTFSNPKFYGFLFLGKIASESGVKCENFNLRKSLAIY